MKNSKLTYGKIYGQENNLSTSAIARMNLYLHGARDVQIRQGDTLRKPFFLEGGKLKTFNCVLANPPFGMSKWGADVFESDQYGRNIWGCPTDANADFAWLQHMIKSMDKDNGRCAVVLPQGALFHGGKEGSIREEIIKADLIEAVITLVGGVFYSSGVSACIMFLTNKKEHKHKGRICLIDGSEVYTPMRAQNVLSDENVDTLYNLYADYEDVVERCKVVTLADVEKGGYDLTVKRYIEKKPQEVVPPEVVRRNYFEILEKVRTAEDKMQRLLLEGGYISGK